MNGDTQNAANVEAANLRKADHAARLAKAVRWYRANSDIGFDACAKLFRVGSQFPEASSEIHNQGVTKWQRKRRQ